MFCILAVISCLAPLQLALAAESRQEDDAAERWAKYDPEFQKFALLDQERPPVPGGVLLVGSSIFRRWTNVAELMAPLPVLNRAFGGSRTGDQLARFEQVVLPYVPEIIVYYCGSNDISSGKAPSVIAANFRAFVARVHAALPQTRIVFVSIIRSPQKMDRWDRVIAANELISGYCSQNPLVTYVDVNPAVFDDEDQPRLDLYLDDRNHLRAEAYLKLAALIKPVLLRLWGTQHTGRAQ